MEPTITAERDGSEATVAAENSGIRRLPDWFNPGVIRTPAELAAVETNLVILESTQVDSEAVTGDTESNTLDSDEASTSTSEASKKSETKKFEITPNLFSELRDVVSAAMIPNSKGELYKSETGTLVTYPEGSLEFCQQVLLQLAKDMGTSLIMLELEDLEDFAELFDALEYGPDGNSNSSFGNPDRKKTFELVKYYFGVRSERHAAESDYERSQKAIAFMLDFLGDKSPDQLEGVSGTLATSQPILVYLYGEKEMDDLNRAYRVYRRIWEAIASKRQKGEQVAFIVSAPEDQGKYASCSCCLPSRCVTKLKHKIHVGAGRTVILPNGHADVDSFHSSETDADFRNGTRNLRHLKRMLRRQMQQKSDRHLDWVQMQLFNGIKVPDVAKITWTDDDIQRATTQIAGRSWANPKLDYNDVRQVLERLCLYGTPTAEAEPEADAKDDSSRSSENSGLTTPSDSIIDSPSTGETSDAELEVTPSIDEIKEYNEGPNAWPIDESMAKKEWEEQKQSSAETNGALDDLMGMIGLESVKRKFMEIKHLMDTSRRQEVKISEQYFGCVLIGNPGTGKTTVARLYARLLSSLNIVPGPKFETTTGTKLFNGGIAACEKVIGRFESDEGGVIFVDDAHHLVNSDGSSCDVLNYITSEIDRLRGKVVFIFAGYPKPMESFLGSVPGLQSRIPFIINFDSYQDAELHQIFVDLLKKKFGGKMQVENGLNGLYVRVLIRRISRARVRASFANARQVQNSLHAIAIRQAKRLASSRRRLKDEDDMFLTKADLLGPPPSTALQDSEAWEKLQAMIGLASVKEEIQVFVNQLQVNYNRELAEQPLIECSLNKVFLGNPGTGKTTVAKYYGQILADIGLLSKGEIMAKTPADFIGSHLGQSEQNTKAILAAALGKVLIIDEAYGLSGAADDGNTAHTDNPYKSAVVDAIVGEVQSTASEDRCVLLLGYKDRMETMFQSVNPALGRRFPLSSAFDFADYTEEEMREILDRMLQVQGFTASDRAKKVAMEVLSRARHHRNYGNAGEVNILLDQAKMRQQKRLQGNAEGDELLLLEPQDFDPDFNRVERSEASIRTLMQDFVGADALIDKMEGYKRIVKNAKARDLDPRCHLPFTFLFRGPPGTGKTTMAQRMGQVFYDMGLLGTTEVISCSATDLIGEYVGQTGPKTKRLVQRALGKVLFIDEAYHLSESRFGRDAVVELMNLLTHESYQNKVVTILAGYDEEMDRLLAVNPGMSSRFPEALDFKHLAPGHCHELLLRCLQENKLSPSTLQPDAKLLDSFKKLAALPGWANARDVQTLARSIFGTLMKSPEVPSSVVSDVMIHGEIAKMLEERQRRTKNVAAAASDPQARPSRSTSSSSHLPILEKQKQASQTQTRVRTATAPPKPAIQQRQQQGITKAAEVTPERDTPVQLKVKAALSVEDPNLTADDDNREPGVSDIIWAQLQEAKAQRKEQRENISELEGGIHSLEGIVARLENSLAETSDSNAAKALRAKLDHATQYLKEQRARLKEAKSEVDRESEIIERLLESGLCPLGYEWLKEGEGYRCAGGTHFMTHDEILKEYNL